MVKELVIKCYKCWLVVYLPLWNMWKSVGMMTFHIPNIWKINNVPNHQPADYMVKELVINGIKWFFLTQPLVTWCKSSGNQRESLTVDLLFFYHGFLQLWQWNKWWNNRWKFYGIVHKPLWWGDLYFKLITGVSGHNCRNTSNKQQGSGMVIVMSFE